MATGKKRILITGGCGFIGHHIIEHLLKNTDWEIVNLDKLTYASSGLDRLRDLECFDEKRVLTLTTDLSRPISIMDGLAKEIGEPDYILHLAAETHVDRSIKDPEPFIISNVMGTMRLLDFVRAQKKAKKVLFVSTDEVFGPAPQEINYREGDRHNPSNPYAAAKAGAEDLCVAYANTYKVPIVIMNSMNAFGERQHPEKFIPSTVKKVLKGETVLIHSDPTRTKSGSRFYLHCRNIAEAVIFILEKTTETLDIKDPSLGRFNVVGEKEITNLELARYIAKILGKELKYEMVSWHESRPGHDLRYALDGSKLKNLGFKYPKTLEESLQKTIEWMTRPENIKWLNL